MYLILVGVFGTIGGDIYSSLKHNTVLTTDTTLYCITENKNTPQVLWSYVNLAGTSGDFIRATDVATGVSILHVYTTQPGSYSCEVTENGGRSRTYTAIMKNVNSQTGTSFLPKLNPHTNRMIDWLNQIIQ